MNNKTKKRVSKKNFFKWFDSMKSNYKLIGPVKDRNQAFFREVASAEDLFMEYKTTMLSPGKLFLCKPKEELFRFKMEGNISTDEIFAGTGKKIIAGVHPCDINAIFYLDRVFLGSFRDLYYEARRKNTIIISLNCSDVSENCFCSSTGTGPFLHADAGYDMLLTDFGDEYLVEIKNKKAEVLFDIKGRQAGINELRIKSDKERALLNKFKKTVNIKGLDKILMDNMDNPVWQDTAEDRCLSCSNCVMVCPTCFCYNIADETGMDMKTVTRSRHLDACQDIGFAEVHGGNFRQRRAARLRQFVTHNLDQTGQHGLIKTVGCGRCITWCPTGIDLTEIVSEIRSGKKGIKKSYEPA